MPDTTGTETPSPTPPKTAPDPTDRTDEPVAGGVTHPLAAAAAFFDRKGAGPPVLSAIALAFATLGSFAFVVNHPGLGGLLGAIALLVGELGKVPRGPSGETRVDPLARGLNHLVDLVLVGGIVAAAAGDDSGVRVLLGLLALGVLAWLPYLDAVAAPGASARRAGLWHRPERLAVLLLGALLGRLLIALLLVVVVGVLDAWQKLERVRPAPDTDTPAGPSFLSPLLRADGSLQPIVRWGSLLLAVLLLLVLPQADGWHF